jgi:hypothetical protein
MLYLKWCLHLPVRKPALILAATLTTSIHVVHAQKKDPVQAESQRFENNKAKKAAKDTARSQELRTFLNDQCYCADASKCDPRKYYYQGNQQISTYSMNRLIRQDITKITLSQDGSPVIGNYASLQYADNNTRINLNTSFYNPFMKDRHRETDPIKTLLSVNVKASISDGVSSLFASKNATSGTSVTLRYSILSPKTKYERYDVMLCNNLKLFRENLVRNYNQVKKNWDILFNVKRQPLQDKFDKAKKALDNFDALQLPEQVRIRMDSIQVTGLDLAKERRNLEKILIASDRDIDKDTLRTAQERTQLKHSIRKIKERDLALREQALKTALAKLNERTDQSVSLQRDVLLADYITAATDLNSFESSVTNYDASAAIDSTYKLLFAIESKDVKWDYYKLKWFDIDGSIGGEKYQMFDNTLPVGQQVYPKPFTTWSGGFTLNYFESGKPDKILRNGYFVQWGFHVSNTSNLVGASTLDVTTTDTYDDGLKKTTTSEKKTAYAAPFSESYLRSFGFRFSAYQDEKQSSSLNFYNTTSLPFEKNPFKIDKRPDVLLGTGYTMAFLDKDKAKAFLNVELFVNFSDILNSAGADTKFYQRHELGLRVGVPFNSIFINK